MEEKERFEYYLAQNQLYDKTNDELYCFGIEQDKTRLVDFLNLMNEDWWALYIRNKELREENQQLKQRIEDQEESYNNTMRYLNKTRSALLNLSKKIVGEIKRYDVNANKQKVNYTEYVIGLNECLDTILNRYGGKDE